MLSGLLWSLYSDLLFTVLKHFTPFISQSLFITWDILHLCFSHVHKGAFGLIYEFSDKDEILFFSSFGRVVLCRLGKYRFFSPSLIPPFGCRVKFPCYDSCYWKRKDYLFGDVWRSWTFHFIMTGQDVWICDSPCPVLILSGIGTMAFSFFSWLCCYLSVGRS